MFPSSQKCFFKVVLGELILGGEGEEGADEKKEGDEVLFTSLNLQQSSTYSAVQTTQLAN